MRVYATKLHYKIKVNQFFQFQVIRILCSAFALVLSVNKYAFIRYKVLDRCFRNSGRMYFIDHYIKYLYNLDNAVYWNYLGILNRLAIASNEMATMLKFIDRDQKGKLEYINDLKKRNHRID